jgi:hypothetical protein
MKASPLRENNACKAEAQDQGNNHDFPAASALASRQLGLMLAEFLIRH